MRKLGSPGLFFVLFVVFPIHLRTLCPAVYWDDAGELALAGAVLGVSHPPGQSLHALMGRATCLMPLGSNGAFRTNLLSALLGSGCVLLAYHFIQGMRLPRGERRIVGLLAGASLAWGFTFWGQCVVTENSTLHLFFCIVLWGLFSQWMAGKRENELTRAYGLAALLFCIGIANHPALLLLLPGLFFLLPWRNHRRQLRPSRATRILALGLIGSTSYWVLLPLLAARNPLINLGDPSRWHRFLWVLLVQQYQETAPTGALLHEPLLRLMKSLQHLAHKELPPGFPILILSGVLGCARDDKRTFAATLILLPIFLYLDLNPSFIRPYQLPLYFVLILWAGMGAAALLRFTKRYKTQTARILCLLLASSLLLDPFFLLFRNQATVDRSGDWSACALAQDAFRSAERPALFLTGSGHVFHLLLHDCWMDGRENSVAVLSRNLLHRSIQEKDKQPGLKRTMEQHWPWVQLPTFKEGALEDYIRLNHPNLSIYWEGLDFAELGLNETYEMIYPSGLFFQATRTPWEKRSAHAKDKRFWVSWRKREFNSRSLLAADDTGRGLYSLLLVARGNYFYGTKGKGVQQAAKEYIRATQIDPLNSQAFCNLGVVMARTGRLRGAEMMLRRSLLLDPSQFQAAFSLTRILLDQGNIREAQNLLREASLHCPGKPGALELLGLLEAEAKLDAEASHHLEEALQKARPNARKRILASPYCPQHLID